MADSFKMKYLHIQFEGEELVDAEWVTLRSFAIFSARFAFRNPERGDHLAVLDSADFAAILSTCRPGFWMN